MRKCLYLKNSGFITFCVLLFFVAAFPIKLIAGDGAAFNVIPNTADIICSPLSFLGEGPAQIPAKDIPKLYKEGKLNQIEGNFVNFGRTYNRYWMHFSLSSKVSTDQLILELDNPQLYHLQVYSIVNGRLTELYNTGSIYPFSHRPFIYRNFVFPLQAVANEVIDYYILLDRRDEVLKFSANLYEKNYFMGSYHLNYWFYGGFTGILLFITLFSIFLRIILHASIHAWYALYILLALLFVLSDTGLGYEFLWGNYPLMNKHARTLLGMLAFPVQLQFMQLFISQRKSGSIFWKYVNWNKWMFIALSVVFISVISFELVLPLSLFRFFQSCFYLAYIIGILLVFLSLAEKIRQNNKVALIYLFAILTLMVQIIIVMMIRWHLIKVTIDVSYSMALCILAEIIILTLGLAFRYNYYKREKAKLELALATQQNSMLKRVVVAVEEEKRRIAEDLHDGLGGTLAVVKGMLSHLDPPKDQSGKNRFVQSQDLLDRACKDLRFIAHDLMPAAFNFTSLGKAIEEAIDKANMVSDNTLFSYVQNGEEVELDKRIELNIFRMLNELIHNIRKHAGASTATIQLSYFPSSLQLMVEDNGCGMDSVVGDKDKSGIGLNNLHSRAEYINADVHIDTGKNGTTIICNVPY